MVRRPAVVLGALWVAGAVVATSVGLVAVRLVGNQVGDTVGSPLSGDAVRQALTSVSPTTRHTPAEPSDAAEELGPVRTISTRGGTVGARCRDGEPALLYVTPAEGYRTEDTESDRVRFQGSRYTVTVRLTCTDEALTAATAVTRTEATAPSPTSPPRSAAPEPTATPLPSPRQTEDSPHPESNVEHEG